MAAQIGNGPIISAGSLLGTTSASFPQEYAIQSGPSLFYHSDGVLDVRYQIAKDYGQSGIAVAFLNSPTFCMVDTAPAASAATPVNISAANTITASTPVTLVSTNASGITCNLPFVNFATGAVNSASICLDFGFGTLSVTSGSATATPSGTTIQNYYDGQWLVVAITATNVLFTQVVAVGTTTITLNAALLPTGTNSTAPVGSANYWQSQAPFSFSSIFAPSAHTPYLSRGAGRFFDPLQSCTRGVGIAASATASCNGTTNNFTVVGADVYGQVQSEVIIPVANTTVYGNKTYKWITSVTPNFTDSTAGHTYSVGTSDLFGLNIRSDKFEYTNIFWNGSSISSASSSSGAWTAANTTSPNPNNADAKGTFQPSARGPSATPSGSAANGTIRLVVFLDQPLFNVAYPTNNNPVPQFGVTPT